MKQDRLNRPDKRNSLEIFEDLYRIGREKRMNSKGRLIESSLSQLIPQKCGMKGGDEHGQDNSFRRFRKSG